MKDREKLTIVYVIARFHPFKGGAETNCKELALRAARAGHDVWVYTTDASPDGSKLQAYEELFGIKIVRFHRWNNQLSLGFYPGLLGKLIRVKAHTVHVCNGPGFLWHDFCIFWKRLFSPNTTFICTPHGPFLSTPATHGKIKRSIAKLGRMLLWPHFRLVWANLFDVFIQVNSKQQIWMKDMYGISEKKVKLVPNGIPEEAITQAPRSANNPCTITYLGRIAQYKGVDKLVMAFAKLPREIREQAKIIIMGHPQDFYQDVKATVESLDLANQVEFKLDPTDSERDTILREVSQVHVLPSAWEATGIVLLEAMAAGNCIVTTWQNEAAELLIQQGENGIIYDYNDIQALSETLRRLITDVNLRSHMMARCLDKVKGFTWENIYPKYEQVLLDSKIDRLQ